MEDFIRLAFLAIVLFVSTQLDDAFVLVGLFASRSYRARNVVIGQYIGIAALFCLAVVISLVALAIPRRFIGFLGIAPIVIGCKTLWDACSNDQRTSDGKAGKSQVLAVTVVTLANGGDNVAVYAPVFATQDLERIVTIAVVFAVLTGLSIAVAYWLVSHPALGAPVRRYGARHVPFVLIALGLWILLRS